MTNKSEQRKCLKIFPDGGGIDNNWAQQDKRAIRQGFKRVSGYVLASIRHVAPIVDLQVRLLVHDFNYSTGEGEVTIPVSLSLERDDDNVELVMQLSQTKWRPGSLMQREIIEYALTAMGEMIDQKN